MDTPYGTSLQFIVVMSEETWWKRQENLKWFHETGRCLSQCSDKDCQDSVEDAFIVNHFDSSSVRKPRNILSKLLTLPSKLPSKILIKMEYAFCTKKCCGWI